MEALGYLVVVRPRHHQHFYRDINNQSFTSHRLGAHLLLIYPPPFNPQQKEVEIAREQNLQVNIESIEVEITEDLYEDGQVPPLEIDDEDSPFYGLTMIEYQGAIINWLQREYGEHVEVDYTLYEENLMERNEGLPRPTHRARLSELLYLARRRMVPP